jgi:hypothetical protein
VREAGASALCSVTLLLAPGETTRAAAGSRGGRLPRARKSLDAYDPDIRVTLLAAGFIPRLPV